MYDAAGNLTRDSDRRYFYDCANKLTRIESGPTGKLLFEARYDAFGRRVEVNGVDYTWNGSSDAQQDNKTRFYYDGHRVIENRDSSGNVLTHTVWGDYLDECLLFDKSPTSTGTASQRYYALRNDQYSVHGLVNESGTLVERYRFTAYGTPEIVGTLPQANSAVGFPWLYTGQRFDFATGLHHYKARPYSSHLGRFLTRDPLGYIDGMSMYEYVRGRPGIGIDPYGTDFGFVRATGELAGVNADSNRPYIERNGQRIWGERKSYADVRSWMLFKRAKGHTFSNELEQFIDEKAPLFGPAESGSMWIFDEIFRNPNWDKYDVGLARQQAASKLQETCGITALKKFLGPRRWENWKLVFALAMATQGSDVNSQLELLNQFFQGETGYWGLIKGGLIQSGRDALESRFRGIRVAGALWDAGSGISDVVDDPSNVNGWVGLSANSGRQVWDVVAGLWRKRPPVKRRFAAEEFGEGVDEFGTGVKSKPKPEDSATKKQQNVNTGSQLRDICPDDIKNKPPHSPDPKKWTDKGGKIQVDNTGVWIYSDSQGNSVSYPGGYPDFKSAGFVLFEATVNQVPDHDKDYKAAEAQLGRKYDPATERWHHHEGRQKMQLIPRDVHSKFTHMGGVSAEKK